MSATDLTFNAWFTQRFGSRPSNAELTQAVEDVRQARRALYTAEARLSRLERQETRWDAAMIAKAAFQERGEVKP